MPIHDPVTELQPEFSGDDAKPTDWAVACEHLEKAEIFWLSTVRPDGRPHVTPVIAVWLDGALYFTTGASERKARNLVSNSHCILTTGSNTLNDGLDLVVEGDAVQMNNEDLLQLIADSYATKYGEGWRFTVQDGTFIGDGGNIAQVYEVKPATAFGFGKGTFSQTRWRF
jgi:hypothetical protein